MQDDHIQIKIYILKKTRKENSEVKIMLNRYGKLHNCTPCPAASQRCPDPLQPTDITLLGQRNFADVS